MADRGDVCVLIPTYNEAATIGEIVAGCIDQGFEDVVVMDGHSTDDTRSIAAEHGAEVRRQSGTGGGQGKGQAVREALEDLVEEYEYLLMIDGDGTYDPADAPGLLDPLLDGRAEHVIGERFSRMDGDAMSRLNRFGNGSINRLFRRIYGTEMRDILSGYRAFTTESADRMTLTADGFGIEIEMAAECARRSMPTAVVPVSYSSRPDGSSTNLRPFRDGGRILLMMYLRTKTSNPFVYFGAVGGTAFILGIALWGYVAFDWFVNRVSHEVLALAGAFAILVGVQILLFGVLSDLMLTLHREQLKRIEDRE